MLLLLAFSFSISSYTAHAQLIQQRFLPGNGERGVTGAQQVYPGIVINKRVMRLSPGARIYDRSNRTIVHGHLLPGTEVFYAKETSGDILRIYILTEQEIVALRKAGKR
ncbi:MAG TPA: hypothetical protein VD867_11330 [Burkholderiales bacterium]|nr:hypothetical protein [Burkholderiales bacterium]